MDNLVSLFLSPDITNKKLAILLMEHLSSEEIYNFLLELIEVVKTADIDESLLIRDFLIYFGGYNNVEFFNFYGFLLEYSHFLLIERKEMETKIKIHYRCEDTSWKEIEFQPENEYFKRKILDVFIKHYEV